MTRRTGWKLFFVINIIYLLLGLYSFVQATQQSITMSDSDIFGWLFLLVFASLGIVASYGYAWRKTISFGKFWYLLLVAVLVSVTYEGFQLYQAKDIDGSEKLFVTIVGILYFSFFSRLMLNYATEDKSLPTKSTN
ncbi:hypothetical protein ORJ04_13035 [Rheinheimera baltica]|uniref:Uncharacterized protein n=1 Tax=Rheinheimera baltica TaxID=67576 RepID=A0ABT9I0F4_9GAMM|nr:hypothetical protein [Rheinheimera baltica]MDP5136872.1 hypothetical protein [Rheinheimera baltica]